MEAILYSDGRRLQVSNMRVAVGGKTLAVQNIASVDLRRRKSQSPAWGYVVGVFGFFLMVGAADARSAGGMAFSLIMIMVGVLLAYLWRPQFEVVAATNSGEWVKLYEGPKAEAHRVSNALGQALVSNQDHGQRGNASPASGWMRA